MPERQRASSLPSSKPLRERADEFLRANPRDISDFPLQDVQALVSELQIHQAELEIQNQELLEMQLHLAASRDRYSDLFEFAPIGYITQDRDGCILDANLTIAAMLGMPRENLTGKPLSRFTKPVSQDDLYRHHRAALAKEFAQTDGIELSPDGENRLCVRLTTRIYGSADEGRVRTAVVDITAQVEAEEALGQSESKYRDLFERLDEGFCIIEVLFDQHDRAIDYKFLETNPAFEAQTGIANAAGRRMREIAPDLEEYWFEIYGRVAKTGESVRFQKRAAALDRNYDVFAFRTGRPDQRHVAILFEDVTEQRQQQEELRRISSELVEANRLKDQFLAMLAHELRNPLTPLRSGLDILAIDPGEHEETISIMQEQLDHAVRLVDDLLDVSRIVRGRVELRRKPVELSALIRQAADAVRPHVQSREQELVISCPEHAVWLNADPVRLIQVCENLLGNASKYTNSGGRIELRAEREDGQAVITVSDTGIGIDPDLQPDVFNLFTQSSQSLDRSQGGLGIGLTLVRQLIEMHEGEVSVSSPGEGQGSTFTVRLPVLDDHIPSGAPAERQPLARNLKVLIVDDNVGATFLLEKLLAKFDHHDISTAHDGTSAIEKIEELHPDLVLLDIGLPGQDGYEVAKKIRQNPDFDDVLLVAFTGYGQKKDQEKSAEAGFDMHVVKPPSVDQIREILRHPRLLK